jgi:hypothetical protein
MTWAGTDTPEGLERRKFMYSVGSLERRHNNNNNNNSVLFVNVPAQEPQGQ